MMAPPPAAPPAWPYVGPPPVLIRLCRCGRTLEMRADIVVDQRAWTSEFTEGYACSGCHGSPETCPCPPVLEAP